MPSATITVAQRRAERGDERDGQQDVWKRHHRVDDARDRRVEPAEKARDEAERHADHRRQGHDRCSDEERQPAGDRRVRLNTSRPNSSVPNQNVALGGFRRLTIERRFGG